MQKTAPQGKRKVQKNKLVKKPVSVKGGAAGKSKTLAPRITNAGKTKVKAPRPAKGPTPGKAPKIAVTVKNPLSQRLSEARSGKRAPSHLGTKVVINNLAWSVTDNDLRELLATCGPLAQRPSVHLNKGGKSAGSGEGIFKNRQDAQRCLTRYDKVELDGRPMQLEIIEKLSSALAGRLGPLKKGVQPASKPRGRVKSRVVSMQE